MQEFENVKQALQAAFELVDAKVIEVDGSAATTAQLQELFKESLISIADLLGIEELYLESKKQPQAIVSSEESVVNIVLGRNAISIAPSGISFLVEELEKRDTSVPNDLLRAIDFKINIPKAKIDNIMELDQSEREQVLEAVLGHSKIVDAFSQQVLDVLKTTSNRR